MNQIKEGINDYIRPVVNFENHYQITKDGEVWSNHSKKYIKTFLNSDGYLVVALCKYNVAKQFRISRLVAEAFIDNPHSLPVVNHIDGNKKNNNVHNLEWCTVQHNVKHAFATGLTKIARGEQSHSAKLTWDQVKNIRRLYPTYPQKMIANMFNVDPSTVSKIINKKERILL